MMDQMMDQSFYFSMKHCSKCKTTKPLEEFTNNPKQSQGKANYCKPCSREYYAKWKTPEMLQRKYTAKKQPERQVAHKSYYLLKKYNLTLEDYNKLWDSQEHCCKICKAKENTPGKGFAVDHCHTTGKVRGILCDRCNLLLGKAHDDCTLLEEVINYLKSSSTAG